MEKISRRGFVKTASLVAALFTQLGLICMMLDISLNPISTFVQAVGNIKAYYVMYSCVTILVFPVTWFLFRQGFPAATLYFVLMADYLVLDILKIVISSRKYSFPSGLFVIETLLRVLPVMLISLAITYGISILISPGIWRLIAILLGGTLTVAVCSYFFAMTPGERAFVISKIRKK